MDLRVVTVAAVLAGLTACGGSDGPTANPDAPTPSAPKPSAPAPSDPPSPSASPPPSTSASPREQRIVVTDYTVFQSPSGNILCGIAGREESFVRCDIGEREWQPPPQPADCEFDYGAGTVLGDDGAAISCVSDAVGEVDLTLEYGERIQGLDIVCTSAETGMTCTHQGNGHGFSLARAEYELF